MITLRNAKFVKSAACSGSLLSNTVSRSVYTLPHVLDNISSGALHRSSAAHLGEAVNKSETIYVFKKKDVKQITVNNPRNLNRLTPRLAQELQRELVKSILNPINKLVVLRSTGASHMLGGSDVPAFYDLLSGEGLSEEDLKNPIDIPLQNASRYLHDLYSLATTLIHSSRVTAIWNGHSLIPLPFSLLAPGASYNVPHLQYGLSPDMGTTWLLSQLDVKYPGIAMYMALFSTSSNTFLDVNQLSALGIGQAEILEGSFDQMLLDYSFASSTMEPVDKMLNFICTPTLANNSEKIDPANSGKERLHRFSNPNIINLPFEDIEEYFGPFTNPADNSKDHLTLADFMSTLERDSNDLIKGASKRQWCKDMLNSLRSGSLEVAGGIFAMLKNVRGRSYSSCCTMEYRLLHRLFKNRDSDTHRALRYLQQFRTQHEAGLKDYLSYVDPKIWKTGKDIITDIEYRMNEPLSWKDDKGIDFSVGAPLESESIREYMRKIIENDKSEPYLRNIEVEMLDTPSKVTQQRQ